MQPCSDFTGSETLRHLLLPAWLRNMAQPTVPSLNLYRLTMRQAPSWCSSWNHFFAVTEAYTSKQWHLPLRLWEGYKACQNQLKKYGNQLWILGRFTSFAITQGYHFSWLDTLHVAPMIRPSLKNGINHTKGSIRHRPAELWISQASPTCKQRHLKPPLALASTHTL